MSHVITVVRRLRVQCRRRQWRKELLRGRRHAAEAHVGKYACWSDCRGVTGRELALYV